MIFEIELRGRESKMNELNFKFENKVNPFLIRKIKEIDDEKITYWGYITVEDVNITEGIICSFKNNECIIESEIIT